MAKKIKILKTDNKESSNCVKLLQWKGINRKQSTRRQHISRLKASAFFSLQFFSCYKTQQLILGTCIAIWWLTEPHYVIGLHQMALLISSISCCVS